MKRLIFCLLLGFLPAELIAKEDLLSLSLKELLHISTESNQTGRGIFQSDQLKVSENSLNIGLIVPLRTLPQYSTQLIAAADLAAMEINQNGGINGQPVAIVRADYEHNADLAVELTEKLIAQHKVQFILGPGTSDSAEQVLANSTIKHRIPMISYGASLNTLSAFKGGELFWRLVGSNRLQVSVLIDHLTALNRHQRIYLFGGRDLYSNEIQHELRQALTKNGGRVIGEKKLSSWVNLKDYNLASEIKNIQEANPGAIIFTTKANVTVQILEQLQKHWQGELPLIVTGDTVKPSQIRQAPLDQVEKCMQIMLSSQSSERGLALNNEITKLIDTPTSGFDSAYLYDSVYLIAMAKTYQALHKVSFSQAVNRIASSGPSLSATDYPRLKQKLSQAKNYSFVGASGLVEFNPLGDNIRANLVLVNPSLPKTAESQSLPQCQQALTNLSLE